MEILLQGLYKASQDENEQVVKEVTGKRRAEISHEYYKQDSIPANVF